MATLTAHKRLAKEYRDVTRSPPPFVVAKPLDNNILEWHYLLLGPPDSPYTGGIYWGKVVFPADYPYKPPAIRMLTPSGRFKPGERICLSYSDFHPESWNPGWSVATILTGLVSFMTSNDRGAGSVSASTEERAELASAAWEWNRRQRGFVDVWPEFLGPDVALPVFATGEPTSSPSPSPSPSSSSPSPSASALRQRPSALPVPPSPQVSADIATPPPTPRTATAMAAAASVPTTTTSARPSVWQRYRAWLVVGFTVWLYLFVARLHARLAGVSAVSASGAAAVAGGRVGP